MLSDEYSRRCQCKLYLKLDNIQKTGSFKIRGTASV
jgi:threonine dehydratase